MQGLQNTLVFTSYHLCTNFDLKFSKNLISMRTFHIESKRRTLLAMKKQGKLHVTLPSIFATLNAFTLLTMQYPSTYYVVMLVAILTPCLEDHPPCWLLFHVNTMILCWLYVLQLQAIANPHYFPHNFRTKIEHNASVQGIILQTCYF
jgi:hypothetical protein